MHVYSSCTAVSISTGYMHTSRRPQQAARSTASINFRPEIDRSLAPMAVNNSSDCSTVKLLRKVLEEGCSEAALVVTNNININDQILVYKNSRARRSLVHDSTCSISQIFHQINGGTSRLSEETTELKHIATDSLVPVRVSALGACPCCDEEYNVVYIQEEEEEEEEGNIFLGLIRDFVV